MSDWTQEDLVKQVHLAKESGMYELLHDAAKDHGLPFSYLLAVASRETNIVNMIGDAGHGIGVIQIDTRFHTIAADAKKSGSWHTNPKPLVEYGATLLRNNRNWAAENWPHMSNSQWLKIAAAAYNCGNENTRKSVAEGDCDKRTTGHNYGRDVIKRMLGFAEILEG